MRNPGASLLVVFSLELCVLAGCGNPVEPDHAAMQIPDESSESSAEMPAGPLKVAADVSGKPSEDPAEPPDDARETSLQELVVISVPSDYSFTLRAYDTVKEFEINYEKNDYEGDFALCVLKLAAEKDGELREYDSLCRVELPQSKGKFTATWSAGGRTFKGKGILRVQLEHEGVAISNWIEIPGTGD